MNLQSVCLCVGMWRYCRSSTADGLSGISPSFINFSCPFVLVQTTVARDSAELDLLCLETLSVTLALSSEMLSLTSLTYDSSSEPCEGNRYTGEWGSAVVQHERIRTASHSHTHACTAVCHWLTNCSSMPAICPTAVIMSQDTAVFILYI